MKVEVCDELFCLQLKTHTKPYYSDTHTRAKITMMNLPLHHDEFPLNGVHSVP